MPIKQTEKMIEGLAILLVEQNHYLRKLTRTMLVNIGAKTIYEAPDGVAALEQAAGGEGVVDSVLHEISVAATEVGIEAGSPEAAELARRLAEVELGR